MYNEFTARTCSKSTCTAPTVTVGTVKTTLHPGKRRRGFVTNLMSVVGEDIYAIKLSTFY